MHCREAKTKQKTVLFFFAPQKLMQLSISVQMRLKMKLLCDSPLQL